METADSSFSSNAYAADSNKSFFDALVFELPSWALRILSLFVCPNITTPFNGGGFFLSFF